MRYIFSMVYTDFDSLLTSMRNDIKIYMQIYENHSEDQLFLDAFKTSWKQYYPFDGDNIDIIMYIMTAEIVHSYMEVLDFFNDLYSVKDVTDPVMGRYYHDGMNTLIGSFVDAQIKYNSISYVEKELSFEVFKLLNHELIKQFSKRLYELVMSNDAKEFKWEFFSSSVIEILVAKSAYELYIKVEEE